MSLTDQKIEELWVDIHKGKFMHAGFNTFARAIEAEVRAEAKQEPVWWYYLVNGKWDSFSKEKPPEDAYDEGTLRPLYAAPVVQANKKPFGYYDHFSDVVYRGPLGKYVVDKVVAGGNLVTTIYAAPVAPAECNHHFVLHEEAVRYKCCHKCGVIAAAQEEA